MSKFIEAKSKTHGNITFAIQQYIVGLYVCIYKNGRMLTQFGCSDTEDEFIKKLKENKDLIIKI